MYSLTVLVFKIKYLQMSISELWWEFWKILPNYCPIFLDYTLGQPFTQFTMQVWSVTFLVVASTWLHEDVILMDKWERKRISLPNSKNHWKKKKQGSYWRLKMFDRVCGPNSILVCLDFLGWIYTGQVERESNSTTRFTITPQIVAVSFVCSKTSLLLYHDGD